MKAIYLTGFMGAGKTTVGEHLSIKLNIPVLDTDHEIRKKLNMTIKEIFEQYGESFFRDTETEILSELPKENVIITTGGGIILRDENRQLMKSQGKIIFLHADLDIIYERVHTDSNRPLASKKSKDELKGLYDSRINYYRDCTFTVETSNKSVAEIVDDIIIRLK